MKAARITYVHDHDCAYKGIEVTRQVAFDEETGAIELAPLLCADYETHHEHVPLKVTSVETREV